LARGRVVQTNRVLTPRGQHLTIPRKGHRAHAMPVPAELADFLARGRVPKPHGLVFTSRSQGLAVRSKPHRPPPPFVAVDPADFLARGRVPQINGGVPAPRSQRHAIGRKRQRPDPFSLGSGYGQVRLGKWWGPCNPANELAGGRLPQSNRITLTRGD